MTSAELNGLNRVQSAIDDLMQDVGEQTELMTKVILDGISMNTKPFIPVDTSFLINSEYQEISTAGTDVIGTIGYGAKYAIYVHEGPQKNWQKPGASNLFLEKGFEQFKADDLANVIERFSPS